MSFPNDDTKFKPGVSGNPAGKPKGTLSRSTLYKKWLEVADAEGLTEADKIVLAQITKAKTGDTTAAAHVIDSAMGKLTDKQEVDMNANISWPLPKTSLDE